MSVTRLVATLTVLAAGLFAARAADHLTSRPRPEAPPDPVLKAGDRLVTKAGEQRRVRLADRALVFVRQGTTLAVTDAGVLDLRAGEVYVEAAGGELAPAVTVKTPKRTVEGRDSRFGVRAGDGGTAVLVAAGSVKVSGVKGAVVGGQRLAESADEPTRAPRVSHLLQWTRELRSAGSLVPASGHAGGSLVAKDEEGQEGKLELRRYHIDVHIEGGFARTTIDQTYFNHHLDRLEGTFRFPLPPDASLSRLAMYVDGNRMEGGMAEREHARGVYETIRHQRRDPALLEWVDGSTFKMRVFPLEPRQEKRILLSYTQRLPVLEGEAAYRFPAGHSLGKVARWSLNVTVKGGAGTAWRCESHALAAKESGSDLVLAAEARDATLDRDVVLGVAEKDSKEARFSTFEQDGAKYLLVRYRPGLAAPREPSRRDWVVLVETSGDREPLLARAQVELVRALLSNAGRDDTFAVITAGTRARALKAEPVRNDPAAVSAAMAELERAHLIGAFDLGAALEAARPLLEAAKSPYLVHVGSGIPAMGERKPADLLKRLPAGTRYVGVGVGRRWDRALMQTLAEKTGGYFTQVNPDEPVAWRGLDLAATLDTPRLLDASVSDPSGKATFLPFGRLVCQGEELAAVCRVEGAIPDEVRVSGTLEGKPFERTLAVKPDGTDAAYLPRSWAKLQIDRLLAEDAAKHKEAITELSKKMYVMTPFTSLLVLESDDMYTQFKVDRGRKDHWALYDAPAKIKVVVEPLEGDEGDPRKGIKPSRRAVANTVVWRGVTRRPSEARNGRVLALGDVDGEALAADEPMKKDDEKAEDALRRVSDLKEAKGRYRMMFSRDGATLATAAAAENLERPVPLSFNLDRIEELSVPGEVDGRLGYAPPAFALTVRGTTVKGRQAFARRHDFGIDVGMQAGTRMPPSDFAGVAFELAKPAAGTMEFLTDAPHPNSPDSAGESVDPSSLLYSRPRFDASDRLFFDLMAYAPGLNTSLADLRAVLDAEARPDLRAKAGRIDPKAAALLDAARKPAWRTMSVEGCEITFDGAGRYAWQRTLESGLKEQVVCDGTTLYHLYPEIGLAARRSVSRHHRVGLAALVPSLAPAAEDLARGSDVVLIDESTVAVVPHRAKDAKKHLEIWITLDRGAVRERRIVEMPAKKVLAREEYVEGAWKTFDADDKVVGSVKAAVRAAEAPALRPALTGLVVLDLPFRNSAHVRKTLGIEKKGSGDLTFAEATRMIGAHIAEGSGGAAVSDFNAALANREQRQLGYYVLLAAAGVNLDSDNTDVLDAHPHEPLAHYLSLHSSPTLRKHASRWAAASNVWGDGFLRRLGVGHALIQRWSSAKALGNAVTRRAERTRALEYIEKYKGSALAWTLLGLMLDRTAEEEASPQRGKAYLELARAYGLFAGSAVGGAARYEQARCLWRGGEKEAARKQFAGLYRELRDAGGLPRIDGEFRAALAEAADGWAGLIAETAGKMFQRKDRAAVLLLARQCWQLDDHVLSRRLLAQATDGLAVKGKEGLPLHRAAIAFLAESGQHEEADRLIGLLLADAEHAKRPDLWRTAANIASRREMPARELECRERALALEFAAQPEVIDLERVRADYRGLLGSYRDLAKALATLKVAVPEGFAGKVVRAADRWRALDSDPNEACRLAAEVLRGLGERELAFDYLTTTVAARSGESDVWWSLAGQLERAGERDRADRAYDSAFEREGTNAQILWDRAENLRKAGRRAAAKTLYEKIAAGDWQPRFASLKQQARWMAEGK